jgi:hypothetical protein
VGTADLRPDRLPPVIATAPIWRSIEASAGAFCLTLIAWLAWVIWRNRRALATQPFASALREMRTLDEEEPRAWQALHRAFDRTAGRVIQHATLPTLFERAPQLIPARAMAAARSGWTDSRLVAPRICTPGGRQHNRRACRTRSAANAGNADRTRRRDRGAHRSQP